MKKGCAGILTHDYKRHGSTTLFAALKGLPAWEPVRARLLADQCQPQ